MAARGPHGKRSSQCALGAGESKGPCERTDAAACDYSAAADHEGAGNPSGVALYAKAGTMYHRWTDGVSVCDFRAKELAGSKKSLAGRCK